MSLPTAASSTARALGTPPGTAARIVDELRPAGLIRPGKRRHPPMWTEEDYISLLIALIVYLDLASVADRTRTFGALEFRGSRGLRPPLEVDQRPLLGDGTFREVLIRLLRSAARRLVAGDAGQEATSGRADEPPWPHRFHFNLSHPAVSIFWFDDISRCDNYAPPRPAPLTAPLMIMRTADVASDLLSATAEAFLEELARHGVDRAAHLSSDRSSDT
jgi:hypothetical protein